MGLAGQTKFLLIQWVDLGLRGRTFSMKPILYFYCMLCLSGLHTFMYMYMEYYSNSK